MFIYRGSNVNQPGNLNIFGSRLAKFWEPGWVNQKNAIMKKILFLAGACMFISVISFAQQPSVFVKGGVNFGNITTDKDGRVDDANTRTSFHVGVQGDLPITRFFAIQPAVLFTGKGAKLESGNTSGDTWVRSSTNPYYIEVPVNAVIKLPIGEESSIFIGAGPYAAVGVGGKNRIEGELLGVDFSRTENIKFSNDDPFTSTEEGAGYGVMRRFDYGLNGTVGIQASRFLISANYGLGLAKLQSGSSSSENELGKHRVVSLSVGFRL